MRLWPYPNRLAQRYADHEILVNKLCIALDKSRDEILEMASHYPCSLKDFYHFAVTGNPDCFRRWVAGKRQNRY